MLLIILLESMTGASSLPYLDLSLDFNLGICATVAQHPSHILVTLGNPNHILVPVSGDILKGVFFFIAQLLLTLVLIVFLIISEIIHVSLM